MALDAAAFCVPRTEVPSSTEASAGLTAKPVAAASALGLLGVTPAITSSMDMPKPSGSAWAAPKAWPMSIPGVAQAKPACPKLPKSWPLRPPKPPLMQPAAVSAAALASTLVPAAAAAAALSAAEPKSGPPAGVQPPGTQPPTSADGLAPTSTPLQEPP